MLNQETTRHLMTSFLWVAKNTDQTQLRGWWTTEVPQRLDHLIHVLELCVSNFEYKGKKMMKRYANMATKRGVDRRRLENALAGAGSARMEFLKRRAANADRSPGGAGGGGGEGLASSSSSSTAGGTRFNKETWFQIVGGGDLLSEMF